MPLADPATQPQFYRDVPGKRLIAWIIDTVLIVVMSILIVPFTAFVALLFFVGLMAVVSFVYRTVTLATGSATLGMRLMAIEIRDSSGARLDLSGAFLHTLGYTLSWAVAPLQLVSAIMMATSERGQGLTDMVMGTTALNRRARG